MYRFTPVLAAAVLAALWGLAGCGAAPAAPAHHRAAAAAAPAELSFLQVCQQLRADMLANGGQPDQPTADRLSTALLGRGLAGLPNDMGALDSDMKVAGTQGTADAEVDLLELGADCQQQHVTLPGS